MQRSPKRAWRSMSFSKETQEYYLGSVEKCYLGYSTAPEIRERCASGGIVSAALISLLRSGQIDGALVSKMELTQGDIRAKAFIATSEQDVLSAAGSIYFDTEQLPIQRLRDFPGRLAVVGLPCHLNALKKVIEKDAELADKIVLKIGLFCGHMTEKALLLKVLEKKGIAAGDINKISFRKGKWRGRMHIYKKDGSETDFPFSHFSVYRNLNLFSLERCLHCADHTAERSDISCGDAWLNRMKREPIKHSIFLSRGRRGSDVLDGLIKSGDIVAVDSSPLEVFLSQKRALILHKAVYCRSKISGLFGYSVGCDKKGYVRWNDYVSSLILMANTKWSKNRAFQKFIFIIPRQILYLYMLAYKFFHNF